MKEVVVSDFCLSRRIKMDGPLTFAEAGDQVRRIGDGVVVDRWRIAFIDYGLGEPD